MNAQPGLPVAEFAFPGPLRDQLVAAILDGSKTSTTSTLVEYTVHEEPLPAVGDRSVVVDSANEPVAVIETTAVKVVRLADVDLGHARDEGEGYASVDEWRLGHEDFWHSPQMREALDDSEFCVDDETRVVLERFHVVERLN